MQGVTDVRAGLVTKSDVEKFLDELEVIEREVAENSGGFWKGLEAHVPGDSASDVSDEEENEFRRGGYLNGWDKTWKRARLGGPAPRKQLATKRKATE